MIRYALVPIDPDANQRRAGCRYDLEMKATAIYGAMLTASPGADLLARIVTALEGAHGVLLNEGIDHDAAEVQAILDELEK